MTDPDAFARDNPTLREYSHLSAHNIENGVFSSNSTADYALEYVPPAPPYNSGLHRYVVLVYAQDRELNAATITADHFANGVGGGYRFAEIASSLELELVAANLFEGK